MLGRGLLRETVGQCCYYCAMREASFCCSTGITQLDAVTGGGVQSGTLWAVLGMRGVGVTELVLQICLAAAVRDRRPSRFVNSHLPARALRGRAASIVHRSSARRSKADAPLDALESASMTFGLDFQSDDAADAMFRIEDATRDLDMLVVDTLDEAIVGAIRADFRQPELVGDLRTLRRAIQHTSTAMLVTARVAPVGPTAADVTQAWRHHPMHESIMDAADVVITLSESSYNVLRADVDVRGNLVRPVELARTIEPWSTPADIRWTLPEEDQQ